MTKFLKISEIAYLVIGIISIFEVIMCWSAERDRAYVFLLFGVVSLGMFFFRRFYRKRIEKRKQQ